MEVGYTPRQRELGDRARALARELMPFEESCERGGGLSSEEWQRVRELTLDSGLGAVNMPSEWGGGGLTILEQAIVEEQLGQLTNALRDVVWRPPNSLRRSTPDQRERYLLPAIRGERVGCVAITEEHAGSDSQAIATVAQPDGDGWLITGEKWFVTRGDIADFVIVLALALPERRPTLFLVDRGLPGFRVARVPAYMHTGVFHHAELVFDGVPVGRPNVLGEVGGGYELTRDWFVEERLLIGARAIGAAERALREAVAWAERRVQFGRPIIDNQMIQAMVADSACEIALNRALVYQVASEADAGLPRKLLHAKAAMVKLAAAEAADRVVDRCVQIFGGRGYMRENPVERLYREVRVNRIWEGTSEIQRLIIANHVVKRGLDDLLSPARRVEATAAAQP
jgi:acyl-CoA dehydrogenase